MRGGHSFKTCCGHSKRTCWPPVHMMGQWPPVYIIGQWPPVDIIGQWPPAHIMGQWPPVHIMGQWMSFFQLPHLHWFSYSYSYKNCFFCLHSWQIVILRARKSICVCRRCTLHQFAAFLVFGGAQYQSLLQSECKVVGVHLIVRDDIGACWFFFVTKTRLSIGFVRIRRKNSYKT